MKDEKIAKQIYSVGEWATPTRDEYLGQLKANRGEPVHRILVGIPMTGLVRSEWMMARYGQVVPCNWSQVDTIQWLDQFSPLQYTVADARNLIVTTAVEMDFEWVFFIDHDTILPQGTILKLNQYCLEKKYPVVAGLYFTKSAPAEPLVYRGRGNSYYKDWMLGEAVWVDAVPMGCTLIHISLLKVMYDEAESYDCRGHIAKRIFETPANYFWEPELHRMHSFTGTEDIHWCSKVMDERIFDKAGWPEFQEKEFPFVCDTSIYCKHIDWDGKQYPLYGEEWEFMPEGLKAHEKSTYVVELKDRFNMKK